MVREAFGLGAGEEEDGGVEEVGRDGVERISAEGERGAGEG